MTTETTETNDMETMQDDQIPMTDPIRFSFSGGGWLMLYKFGVAKAIQERNLHQNAQFIGASAGALTIVGLSLGTDFDALKRTILTSYVPVARYSKSGAFRIQHYIRHALRKHANLHRYNELNEQKDKVTIIYSSISKMRARKISAFDSEQHLLDALLASCCAAPFVGLPIRFNNEIVMDGSVFISQPSFDDNKPTYTVNSSFSSDADIRPSVYIPPWWAFYPPSEEKLEWLFQTGYNDASRFLIDNGLCESTESAPRSSFQISPPNENWWKKHENEKTYDRVDRKTRNLLHNVCLRFQKSQRRNLKALNS